ncbi:MAG: hypothetical protein KC912_13545 [Proteobacteria bacterium]|nr:hypothetical protein [Pseudomonadota bacterium]
MRRALGFIALLSASTATAGTPRAPSQIVAAVGAESEWGAPGGLFVLDGQFAPCMGERCFVQPKVGAVIDHLGSAGQRNTRFLVRTGLDTPYAGLAFGIGYLAYDRGPFYRIASAGAHPTGLASLWAGKPDVIYAVVGTGELHFNRVVGLGSVGLGHASDAHRADVVVGLPARAGWFGVSGRYDAKVRDTLWVGGELAGGAHGEEPAWRCALRLTWSLDEGPE